LEDHPELAPGGAKPQADFASISYAVQLEVDRQVQPILDHFDTQVNKQQAFVDGFRFLSPAILAQVAINDLAGASLGRYKHFSRQVDAFFDQWQAYFLPRVFQKAKLTSTDLNQLPTYQFTEEPDRDILARVSTSIAGLGFLAIAVLWLAAQRLRRVDITG
jgi:ABC-2 type transport system permease protein